MNYRRQLGPRDSVPQPNGDRGWVGVNMRLDPSQLPEGWASDARNCRFRNGVAESRLGSMVAAWLNDVSSGYVQPWGAVYGVGVFRDPNSTQEFVLIAADGAVYACQPNNPPRSLPLPSGVTVTTTCRFEQAFDKVILLRGFDAAPLAMADVVTGFQAIEPSPTGSGLLTIPAALRSVAAANRVFVANDDDSILASDILDYTHYSLTNDFRINQGSADRIVQLKMFGKSTIVALKGRSVYRVDNVYGDLTAASLSTVTTRYGCVAAESVVDCGTDLLWLSQEGVASLTLTTLNEIQTGQGASSGRAPMFSDDIQPLIRRINWRYASGACGALWDDHYYLAVPLDQAETLGPEVSPTGWAPPSSTVTIPVTAGATYRWAPTASESQLVNGAATYTASRDFVAAGATVTVSVLGLTYNGSLRRVWKGVNNAVLVYDLRNGAWAGYDLADSIAYSRFFKARYNDQERLFGLTFDGYVRMLEEDYADRLSQPYVDVTVVQTPDAGDTISVNGGVTVTAWAFDFNGVGFKWGVTGVGLNTPAANLFTDGSFGFYAGSTTGVWAAPDVVALRITNGVRFLSTNGVLPAVTITGTWASVSYGVEQAVQFDFVSRAYRLGSGEPGKATRVACDVQTWAPTLSLELQADGVNETEAVLSGVTRSRTAYSRLGMATYDPTNANDDFYSPYREDYSIAPTDESFAFEPGANVYGHLHQESRQAASANLPARAARVRVQNTTGRLRLMQVGIEFVDQPAPAGATI